MRKAPAPLPLKVLLVWFVIYGLGLSCGIIVGVQAEGNYTVCAAGCDFASVDEALTSTAQPGVTAITVAAGRYTQTSASFINSDVVIWLSGEVTITVTGDVVWLRVFNNDVTIQGGSLTLVGGGIRIESHTLNISSPLTIVNGSGGIYAITSRFYQYADVTADMVETQPAVWMATGSVWEQYGNVYATNAVDRTTSVLGVSSVNSTWHQRGNVSIQIPLCSAMLVSQGTIWEQEGNVNIECNSGLGVQALGLHWHQTGSMTIKMPSVAIGIVSSQQTMWMQQGRVDVKGGSGIGIVLQSNATWNLSNTANIVMGSQATGVSLRAGNWIQTGDITITVNNSSKGIQMDAQGVSWAVGGKASIFVKSLSIGINNTVNAPVTVNNTVFISAVRDSAYAILYPDLLTCCTATCGLSYNVTWTSQGFNYSGGCPTPSPSPAYFRSEENKVVSTMPVLQLDYSAPQIAILPRDEEGKVQPKAAVSVSLDGVMEVTSSVDPSPLAVAVCTNGSWRATDGTTGPQTIGVGWQSFVYSCLLSINATSPTVTSNATTNDNSSNSGSNVTLEVQFDLFNSTGSVSLGDNADELVNLTLTPSFTKLSVRMRGQWPWQSAESRLLLRMAIDPTFTRALLIRTTSSTNTTAFNSSSSSPMASETTWRLEGQKPAGGLKRGLATLVRLVNVVEMDGEWHVGDEWVSYAFEPNASSALVLSFKQFNDSLSYDPDISVLLGRARGGGDEDKTGLIIGVVVAVFVALLLVAVILVTVIVLHRYRRAMVARFYQRRRKAVNFAYYDET